LPSHEAKDIRAVQHVITTIFSAQNALRELAPEYKWTGLGNLLGDYGELIAVSQYNLILAPSGADGYDAIRPDGKTVQVKANHSSSTIGFRGNADYLLVLKIESDGSYEEIFYGAFKIVEPHSNFSKRDNKRTITISKLKKLHDQKMS
jgi:hypothetical protein